MNELYIITLKENMYNLAQFKNYNDAKIALDILNMNGEERCMITIDKYETSAERYFKRCHESSLQETGDFDFVELLEKRIEYIKTSKTYPIELISAETGDSETYDFNIKEIESFIALLAPASESAGNEPFEVDTVILYPSDIEKFHDAKSTWKDDLRQAEQDLSITKQKKATMGDDDYYL